MSELTWHLIATALVLMAVFIPLPSLPGTTGIVYKHLLWLLPLYRHFHLQRHELLPSMAAIIMRQQQEVHGPLGLFFRWFNGAFDWFKAASR